MLNMQMLHSPLSNNTLDYSKYCCLIVVLRDAQQQRNTHLDVLLLNAETGRKIVTTAINTVYCKDPLSLESQAG